MTDLAQRPAETWVSVADIVDATDLPKAYLGKILKELVRADLLRSIRGPGGGYRLARDAAEISLLDVKHAIDGERDLTRCAVGLDPCSDETPCPLHEEFKALRETIRAYLDSTTLDAVARGARSKEALLER